MWSRFVPDIPTVAVVMPIAALLTIAAAVLVAWLRARAVRAPYTRKLFHFIIISLAMVVQVQWGLRGTVVYGAVVSVAVLYAVWRGDGFAFYEALARPGDAPHRSLFILVPLVTTAAGGILANALFPAWAHVGYFVVAWGDAIGEPVGTRLGRHRYRVPSLAGVPTTRSLEGSAAVLAASSIAAFAAIALVRVAPSAALPAALAIGCASAVVEAFSNHGVDNLTVQLVASAVAAGLL